MIDAEQDIFEDGLNVGDIAMTVLDENIMSNSLGGDRYITPEYLAPLPQVFYDNLNVQYVEKLINYPRLCVST